MSRGVLDAPLVVRRSGFVAVPAWLGEALGPLAAVVLVLARHLDLLRGRILVDYDVFVYFYPLHEYAAQRLAQGALPLWNPHAFLGTPLLANPQVALFYPFSLLFSLLSVPYAYSFSLVLHRALGGVFFYAFARVSLGAGRAASTLGALAFCLCGFMAGQLGHLNQVETAIWLPLLVLLFDLGLRRRSPPLLASSGLVLGLQLLAGHPQEAYMALVALGVWALYRLVVDGPHTLVWVALALASVSLIGGAFAAVQLLPTLKVAAEGIRGGGISYADAVAVSLPAKQLPRALLPGFGTELASSEYLGYVGVIVMTAALLALALSPDRRVGPLALLAGLGLFLALGDDNPLYPLLFRVVPGLGAFRVPARWLYLYCFALAGLATIGLDLGRIRQSAALDGRFWPRSRPSRAGAARVALVAALLLGAAIWELRWADPQPHRLLATWGWLAVVGMAALLVATRERWPVARVLVVALAAVELWLADPGLPQLVPVPPSVYREPRSSTTYLQARPASGRVLSIASEAYEVKETPDYQRQYADLPPRALYNLLVATKLNEILMPNIATLYGLDSADGYDGGVLPLKSFVELSGALIPPDRVRPDGVLLSRLDTVPDPRLLDVLNVRYVLDGKVKDAQIDGVYLDRGISVTLRPGDTLTVRRLPDLRATRVALLSALKGDVHPETGAEVGQLDLHDDDGGSQSLPLRAGWETATAERGTIAVGSGLTAVHPLGWTTEGQPEQYLTRLRVERRRWTSLRVRNTSPDLLLEVRAVSLLDDDAGQSQPLVLDDRLERTFFFDMKVYEYPDVLPRAFLAHAARVLPEGDAVAALRDPAFNPRREVLLAPGPGAEALADTSANGAQPDQVSVGDVSPERVLVSTASASGGWLVLSDAYSDGWAAWVDGERRPILLANVALRAVRLPPGQHQVEFRYAPPALLPGAALSILSALAVAALLLSRIWWPRTVGLGVRADRP